MDRSYFVAAMPEHGIVTIPGLCPPMVANWDWDRAVWATDLQWTRSRLSRESMRSETHRVEGV